MNSLTLNFRVTFERGLFIQKIIFIAACRHFNLVFSTQMQTVKAAHVQVGNTVGVVITSAAWWSGVHMYRYGVQLGRMLVTTQRQRRVNQIVASGFPCPFSITRQKPQLPSLDRL